MLSDLLDRIDPEAVVALTRDLVRIDSVFRPETGGCEQAVAAHVAGLLRGWGWPVQMREAAPGRPNVLAFLDSGRPGKSLLFEGHTDVVTEGDPAAWRHPPFAGEVVDGRIYGRGACDTKNNLAAAILAMRALQQSGLPWGGRVLLAVPVDEEGLMLGIKRMIEWGWCDGVDGAIVCEPEENQLCIAQKGAMRATLRVTGKMAHGAMPRSGLNPNVPLARMLVRFAAIEAAECERCGEDPFLGWPSVTPTIVQGPESGAGVPQINVVPERAFAALDIRTTPAQDHRALERALREAVAAELLPGLQADLQIIEDRPCTHTDPRDPVVRASAAAYRAVTGKPPAYNGVPGATDGTFLWAWKGIPIVTYGAGCRTVPHQVDEWCAIDELVETTRIYAAAAAYFLGGLELPEV